MVVLERWSVGCTIEKSDRTILESIICDWLIWTGWRVLSPRLHYWSVIISSLFVRCWAQFSSASSSSIYSSAVQLMLLPLLPLLGNKLVMPPEAEIFVAVVELTVPGATTEICADCCSWLVLFPWLDYPALPRAFFICTNPGCYWCWKTPWFVVSKVLLVKTWRAPLWKRMVWELFVPDCDAKFCELAGAAPELPVKCDFEASLMLVWGLDTFISGAVSQDSPLWPWKPSPVELAIIIYSLGPRSFGPLIYTCWCWALILWPNVIVPLRADLCVP